MQIKYLEHCQQTIATIAEWYFNEWGYLKKDSSVESFAQNIQTYLNTDKIPLMLIAVENNEAVGAMQLKYREMSIYPDKEHWLGGVYVSENHRGKNIAEQMIKKLIDVAQSLDVKTLYLQTEQLDGGLYRKLGWQAIEQVNYRGIDVLVMEKRLLKSG